MKPSATRVPGASVLLAVVVALVAFNLRPAIAAVGPVLPEVRTELRLSATAAALLTMLPVLCFGVMATVAPRLARRAGTGHVLLAVLLAVAAGCLLRVSGGAALLFAGTVVAGGAIAVANVLLPPLIKGDFPARSGLMMGVYTMTLSAAAALAAGAAVPLGDVLGSGWRGGLGAWAAPALLAAVLWLPFVRGHARPPAAPPPGRSLLLSPLAWQVTVFFGLQSLSFYAVLAWLPSIYRDLGLSPVAAGLLLSVAGLASLPPGLLVPAVAARARTQVPHAILATAVSGLGFAGVLVAPTAAPYLWAVLLGAGQGACFALGLHLFVLRTRDVRDTARLSAMAQGIGYTGCAFGPLAVGLLRDATGSWTVPLALLLLLLVPQGLAGAAAGRSTTAMHTAPTAATTAKR